MTSSGGVVPVSHEGGSSRCLVASGDTEPDIVGIIAAMRRTALHTAEEGAGVGSGGGGEEALLQPTNTLAPSDDDDDVSDPAQNTWVDRSSAAEEAILGRSSPVRAASKLTQADTVRRCVTVVNPCTDDTMEKAEVDDALNRKPPSPATSDDKVQWVDDRWYRASMGLSGSELSSETGSLAGET